MDDGVPRPSFDVATTILQAPPNDLLTGLTSPRDDTYLRWLVEFLQSITGVEFAFVGELVGEDTDHIQTLAVQTSGGPIDDFEYDLLHTPCARVLDTQTVCIYAKDVASEFPKDQMLVDMGIESYVGVSLSGPDGQPLGLVVALDTKPMAADNVVKIERLLYGFRERTVTVLEHRRTLRALKSFESHLDPSVADDLLSEFTRAATSALKVKAAFVAHYVDEQRRLRTEIVQVDGKPAPGFEFEVAGTPCEVREQATVACASGVCERYPEADFLVQLDAEAFFGRPLVDVKGRPIGYFAIIHDRPVSQGSDTHPVFRLISERIGFEVQRRKIVAERRAVERRMIESLGILAGGIAHDFNNILVGIVGNADLALALDPRPGAQDLLEGIIRSAEQAAQLCNRMLAQAGRARVSVSEIHLRELVAAVVESAQATAPVNCMIELERSEQTIELDADGKQITQLIESLISNAIDAIGDQPGTIVVQTSVSRCEPGDHVDLRPGGELDPGTYACVEVRDDGGGMDDETVAHMFDPFFTTKHGRHGLGLASALGLAERHHGGLSVESKFGEGTAVRLWLPLPPDAMIEDEPEVGLEPRSFILVVDDEPRVRKVLSLILAQGGYDSLVAEDGLAALDIYERERERIRLVLLDVNMPKLDGIKTLGRLRAINPEVLVILSSGRVELDRIESEEKPNAIATKPFRMKTLMSLLEELLD